jgi:hypothetical protein
LKKIGKTIKAKQIGRQELTKEEIELLKIENGPNSDDEKRD